MKPKTKKILILVGAALLLGGGYWLVFKTSWPQRYLKKLNKPLYDQFEKYDQEIVEIREARQRESISYMAVIKEQKKALEDLRATINNQSLIIQQYEDQIFDYNSSDFDQRLAIFAKLLSESSDPE